MTFFMSHWGHLKFLFTEMYSPLLFIDFGPIGEFDWLSGREKGYIFVKMFKNLLLRNDKGDEAETWYTCLG